MEMEANLIYKISLDQILAKFYDVFYLKKFKSQIDFYDLVFFVIF